ncbi:Zn(II)2Cys6 transcription factor [Penicillium mononematosum]|uniref:Zn(II)2Cys6 transcription factor n=1 Tax=Penicillium mononematosum TaxID=268346 RepID=UPI002547BB85|nr:Zn(II)2Cys6 transcription factor [Penicillium mononematosum]KAJ6179426.1 Zn(II)2Cys6 transcription factor [Penicillium mononematosum]
MHGQNLEDLGHLYLTWCHNQPLALFDKDTFVQSLPKRNRELILVLQALAFRFPPGSITPQYYGQLSSMAETARQIVMNRIMDRRVDLPTLQTLCLLSVVDFADGKTIQAALNLNIANHLAQSVPQSNALDDPLEWNDCMGSITILSYLQGSVSSTAMPIGHPIYPQYPINSLCGPETIRWRDSRPVGQFSKGILRFTTPLAQAWQMARTYATSRVAHDVLPPWDPQSDYSRVMQRHLEIDCGVPLKYRFAANRLEDEDSASCQQRRDYWGPWLFTQFIYAAIPCLLNHPLLLSMRLRNFRYTIPQAFIQQSFEAISRNSRWIMYYLDLLESKSFQLSDPALAHCVVIIATIHLQHSFVQDPSLRNKAEMGFKRCLDFLYRMASVWPNVSAMCQNLETLRQSVHVVQSPDATQEMRSFSINGQLLWDTLAYDRAGLPNGQADESMFSGIFVPNTERQGDELGSAAEFDLVGSIGISGHKAIPMKTPLFPPDGDASASTQGSFGNIPGISSNFDMGVPVDAPGLNEQEGFFLQPTDFGRAIDDWLNFELNG